MVLHYQKTRGFTLTEVMIVVAILGILAAIAIPSYQQHVMKTRRAECTGSLMTLASQMEKFYAENNTYDASAAASPCDGGGTTFPCDPNPSRFIDECPADGSGPKTYDLKINSASGTSFEVRAIPVSGAPMKGDPDCRVLTLDNTGLKGVDAGSGASPTKSWDECW